MEKEDEFLHEFFSFLTQGCYEKAKEQLEKEKQLHRSTQTTAWHLFLGQLHQISLSEKNYMEISFLQHKTKGFLRKDSSSKSTYEAIKTELKKVEEHCKDPRIVNYCQNINQFISARIHLIHFYEKIFNMGTSKSLKYNTLLVYIDKIIEENISMFTDITLAPIKRMYNMECEILSGLFRTLTELQRLQFLPSLACIHGVHSRLSTWESKLQNRDTWKLGFLKNTSYPALYQWLLKFKGTVLSKFSLYFHDALAEQTTSNDMRQLCTQLYIDYYQKMASFQKKCDADMVLLLSDNQVSSSTTDIDTYPIIITFPPKAPQQVDAILKIIADSSSELTVMDKMIYKYESVESMTHLDVCTYVLTLVEPNIYLVLIFSGKKSEKEMSVVNFVMDFCLNLRCTKVFCNLKTPSK